MLCKFKKALWVTNLFVLQEIIQNADDAGARTVRFYLDCRQHGTSSLDNPELARFQGPALLAYNDEKFKEGDWKGIQKIQQSGKAKDPLKVGKFGIGFNSVYHITGKIATCISTTVQWEYFTREEFRQLQLQSIVENIRQFYFRTHASKVLILFNMRAVS